MPSRTRATKDCSRRRPSHATAIRAGSSRIELGRRRGDPTTGWLYVRTTDTPALHKLRVPGVWVPAFSSGVGNTPAARGRAVYQNYCEACHGQPTANGMHAYGGSALINVAALGTDRIKTTVRDGGGAMPAHNEAMINGEQMDWLLTYISDPAAANAGATALSVQSGAAPQPNPTLPFIEGLTRYTGPLGSMFHAANGLPVMRPPWASLVAYDLNEGVIKWRVPLGIVRALAAKGITNTGNSVRAYRNGIVATAGGLIFVGTNGDGYVRAFDKDTGKILWEYDLNANPEGIPAVYEVNGRQYVAFCASYYGGLDPEYLHSPARENQGYYVFALPR